MPRGEATLDLQMLVALLNIGSAVFWLTLCFIVLYWLWQIRRRVMQTCGENCRPGYPARIVAWAQLIATFMAAWVVAIPVPSDPGVVFRSLVLRGCLIAIQLLLLRLVIKEEIENRVEIVERYGETPGAE